LTYRFDQMKQMTIVEAQHYLDEVAAWKKISDDIQKEINLAVIRDVVKGAKENDPEAAVKHMFKLPKTTGWHVE
jgi:hypothetical protein